MHCIADANVLLPLLTEGHAHQAPATDWWDVCDDSDVGLSLPVRMALLRLLTNSRVMGSSTLRPVQAWNAVQALIDDPRVVVIDQVPQGHRKYWYDCIARREPHPICGPTRGLRRWPWRSTATWSPSTVASGPSPN